MQSKFVRSAFAAAAVATALTAVPAAAANITFTARIDAQQEVPPTTSTATGRANFLYGDQSKVLQGTIEFTGLSGEITGMHFHAPAAVGQNAGVFIPIEGPYTSPMRIRMTLTPEQATEFERPGAQLPVDPRTNFQPDQNRYTRIYLNIHTAANPEGEIRGQLVTTRF